MEHITQEQLEEFFSSLNGKYFRDEFYNRLLDYLETNGIHIYDEREENELEQEVFEIAKSRGFIGYDIICEVTDMDVFKDKISEQVRRYGYYIFHFMYELSDENEISTSAVWEKWNQVPPLGWFGGWCVCGHFYPYTLDLAEMEPEENEYVKNDGIPKPQKIYLNDIDRVVFCSDNFFRIYLKDSTIILAKAYKFDAGLAFKFTNTILG